LYILPITQPTSTTFHPTTNFPFITHTFHIFYAALLTCSQNETWVSVWYIRTNIV
jgi:hypothetical protein